MQTSYILSFGRYLKALRESKDIAISSVADHLRVSIWHLMLIEGEDHEKLPDEVYVKGTLRAYADFIGVDAEDIIERYEINRRAYCEAAKSEEALLKSGNRSLFRMMVALCVLCVMALASIIAFNRLHAPIDAAEEKSTDTGSGSAVDVVFFEDDAPVAEVREQHPYAGSGRLHLKLLATRETRVHISIDEGNYEHYILNPKDEMQIEAYDQFNVQVSDAQGVEMYFNDQRVNLNEEQGQPVNVLLKKKPSEKQ